MDSKVIIEQFINNINGLSSSGLINEESRNMIMSKINTMSEDVLVRLISENNLLDYESTKNYILDAIGRRVDLNEYFHIIVAGSDVSLHFSPLDASSLMDRRGIELLHDGFHDAMDKLYQYVKENEKVKNISAVSHLIKRMFAQWFEEYNFHVVVKPIEEAKNDPTLSQYYERFKNYNNKNYSSIGLASIDAEEFIKTMGVDKTR